MTRLVRWRPPLWLRYWFKSPTVRRLKLLEWIAPEVVNALAFYADPDTYFAISFLADPPCGGFAEDYGWFTIDGERCSEDEPYSRARPGERARKALGWGTVEPTKTPTSETPDA